MFGDNYGFVVWCWKMKIVAFVDVLDEGVIVCVLLSVGWELLLMILNMYYYWDYVGVNGGVWVWFLDARVVVVASRREAEKIGDVDVVVEEGDVVEIGDVRVMV